MKTWNNLNNPPVVVALFQLKYNSSGLKLNDFLKFDAQLKHNFPIRRDNIQVGIDLGGSSIPLGVSKITGTSDAQIGSYVYCSVDQKIKLEISQDTITYIDERPYQGWSNFKESALKSLMIVAEVLNKIEVIRTSIRFINRFTFDNFDKPQEYFKTLISSSEDNQLPYPLRQYGFRLLMDIPNTDTNSIVNQNVENVLNNSYIYTFDIDVLDKQHLIFDKETLAQNMEILREIKNEIFFGNVTQKTLDLCN
jgi:uncharacterized protein (TIGR04255 family)